MLTPRTIATADDMAAHQMLVGSHFVNSSLKQCHAPVGHHASHYVVRMVTAGRELYRFRGKSHPVYTQQFMVTAPDTPGKVDVTEQTEGVCLYLAKEIAEQFYGASLGRDIEPEAASRSLPDFTGVLPMGLFPSIARYGGCAPLSVAHEEDVLADFVAFVHQLSGQLSSLPTKRPSARAALHHRILKAREYIEGHRSERISLHEVSHEVGLSQFHLTRTYRQVFGQSLMQAHKQLQLDWAKDQLLAGVPPIQLAERLGFSDISNFGRAFARRHGSRPTLLSKRVGKRAI